MASSSTKDLMQEYHRLAADTLLGGESNTVALAILEAAEGGQVERLQKLLSEHRDLIDVHHPDTGDTPLISAARSGHKEVINILLSLGADVTLENDNRDSVLDVAGDKLRKHILKSISHEDRSMSNAKALLRSAWLGDAVTVKRCLSGSHYLDVNNSNKDGLTPLLLVTKDVAFFSKVQNAMEYNPVDVLEQLLLNHSDVNQSDKHGYSPLHLIASSGPNIHATKMVSLLLQHGSIADSQSTSQSPLHMASSQGHMTVIVALVEEGGANINQQTTDTEDTPLMLSVRGGHNEAAHYLLSKGADVTMVTKSGDSALTVANSPRMKRMIKEAWTEQSENVTQATPPPECDNEDNERGSVVTSPLSPVQSDKRSFFLTDRHISQSLDFESADLLVNQVPCPGSQELSPDHQMGQDTSHDIDRREVIENEREKKKKKEPKQKTRRRVKSDTILRDQIGEVRGPKSVISQSVQDVRKDVTLPVSTQPVFSSTSSRQIIVKERVGMKKTKSTGSRKKPSNLPTHTSVGARVSHDSHVTSRRDQFLPAVFTYSSPPSPKPTITSSNYHGNRLPPINLKNMKAVKMVTVDTREDNLRVHQIRGKPLAVSGSESPLQRSRSLMSTKSEGISPRQLEKKRNSTGSLPFTQQDNDNKILLQPRIVAPQLFGLSHPLPSSHQQSSNRRFQPINIPSQPRLQGNANFQPTSQNETKKQMKSGPPPPPPQLRPMLSIVNEDPESLASSVHLGSEVTESRSDHALLTSKASSSDESTLKASSHSEFETDSLEQKTTPLQTTPILSKLTQSHTPSYTRSSVSIQNSLPPTITQFYELTRQASHTPSSNTITHVAVQDGSIPLSPIWNQDQMSSQSHSEATESNEYITSFVSALAPPAEAAGPIPIPAGLDSGQGESSDEERPEQPSSDSHSDDSNTQQLDTTHCLQWKKGRLLGKGAFGKVWEGLLDTAKLIAVKEVELDIAGQKAQSQYEKLRLEVEILRSLKHRNVVRYLGTSMDDCQVYIFMEFISGGSLQSILKRFGPLNDKTSSHYTRQIVQALKYLHSNGIVHRDIKGANVMVTAKGVIKLIDFGSAKQSCHDVTGDLRSVRGTPNWMAPEVIRGDGYGRKSDIWSLGCTVHEMATSKPPWADYPPEAAIFQIGNGKLIPPLPQHLSSDIITFIYRCIMNDPGKRPGAEILLKDSFLTKFKK